MYVKYFCDILDAQSLILTTIEIKQKQAKLSWTRLVSTCMRPSIQLPRVRRTRSLHCT